MNERRIGIIMNGVTGRMELNQHLVRSILAARTHPVALYRTRLGIAIMAIEPFFKNRTHLH